jgi:hypothetical protein
MLLQLVLLLHVPGSAMPRIPCIHMSPRACCRLWQLSLVPRYRHSRSCISWTLALWSSADWMNNVEWVSRSRCKSPNHETCKRRRASHRSLLLSRYTITPLAWNLEPCADYVAQPYVKLLNRGIGCGNALLFTISCQLHAQLTNLLSGYHVFGVHCTATTCYAAA